jgi:hypothetical protein
MVAVPPAARRSSNKTYWSHATTASSLEPGADRVTVVSRALPASRARTTSIAIEGDGMKVWRLLRQACTNDYAPELNAAA